MPDDAVDRRVLVRRAGARYTGAGARYTGCALRGVGPDEQTTVELAVLAGYDADLADESTRLINRLHDALPHVHPSLERLLGKHFHCPGVLRLLTATGTPTAIGQLGEAGIATLMTDGSPRLARTLPARIVTALADQSVTIPATAQYGRVIRGLADQLSTVLATQDPARRARGTPGRSSSRRDPHLDARCRPQDCHRAAAHRRRRVGVCVGSAYRLLRRPSSDHPIVRPKHQGRAPAPPRQPSPEERVIPVRVLQPQAPAQPRLLRPETNRGKEPHRCVDMPRPTPGRRSPRDDQRPAALPPDIRDGPPRDAIRGAPRGLTNLIGTPLSNGCAFPPVEGAPVLAVVKQIALDAGCDSALGQGGGNGPGNGSGGRRWRA